MTRRRARAALVVAPLLLVFLVTATARTDPAEAQQPQPCDLPVPDCETTTTTPTTPTTTPTTPTTDPTDASWEGSRWITPAANGATVTEGTFSGEFVHTPGTVAIESADLDVTYASGFQAPEGCGPAPGPQPRQGASTTSTSTPETESRLAFFFEVAFTCNGLYDAVATGTLEAQDPSPPDADFDLELSSVRVAVRPQPPRSLLATDNGNQTVTIVWEAPTDMPPDVVGFRVSRRPASSTVVEVLADTLAGTLSFDDTDIPAAGASFFYRVQTLRNSPNGLLVSDPVPTAEALVIGASGSGGGGQASGNRPAPDPGSGGTGVQRFDDALAEDDRELGDEEAAPTDPFGGDTVQRFVDQDGAGLLKPIGAALNIGVWAALLLFLTRRAASAERAERLALELEQSP